jgi:peptidyl-prolyl cis-trans isomerase SurA
MSRISSRWTALILGVAASLVLPWVTAAEVVDRIVAVVNDDIITMSELDQMSKSFLMERGISAKSRDAAALKRQMLENLIDQKLARAEAKKRGIEPTQKEIDNALEQFKKRNRIPDDATLNQALAQADLTLAQLRQQISDQLSQERLFQAAVAARGTVTDAEVRRFYDDQVKEGGVRVHLRMVKLPYPPGATQTQKEELKKKAETIVQEFQKGASLPSLAQRFGLTETDLGFITQGDLEPQIQEIVAKTKPGGLVPIQTPAGFQLVQVVERRAGAPPSFEEAAPEIRRTLLQRDMERRFSEWVKTLRTTAHIKIML